MGGKRKNAATKKKREIIAEVGMISKDIMDRITSNVIRAGIRTWGRKWRIEIYCPGQ